MHTILSYLFFAIAITILYFVFWHSPSQNMTPFPLIDPDSFFNILPNVIKRDTSQPQDAQYFDSYGYLKGERGARISFTAWTKNPSLNDDAYDVDLNIRVICIPSADEASNGLAREINQDKRMFTKAHFIPLTGLKANDAIMIQIDPEKNPHLYYIKTRYENYLFLYVARTSQSGYFESEAQLMDRLNALDAHISTVLQKSIQPDSP